MFDADDATAGHYLFPRWSGPLLATSAVIHVTALMSPEGNPVRYLAPLALPGI